MSNGKVVFTPTAGFSGTAENVKYRVTNAEGVAGEATIRITVTAGTTPTDAPTATDSAPPTPQPSTGSATPTAAATTIPLASTGFGAGTLGIGALLVVLLGTGVIVAGTMQRRRAAKH
ncbi:hypothetical protein [Arthrobacter sp. GMC3]|uniref:Ig-like domain-containing protein n=1 Tax=Arthrobacter sp. GMC3 TaxID=2058894 RepID=UPI0021577105|nr:hypothetical protein [Arthrobacter sp. GMC3]